MKHFCYKVQIILLTNFIFVSSGYGQYSEKLLSVQKEILEGDYKKADVSLKNLRNFESQTDNAYLDYLKGLLSAKTNREDLAYDHFINSRKAFTSIDSIDMAMQITLEIARLVNAQGNNENDYRKYLEEYVKYALKTNNPKKMANAFGELGVLEMDNSNYRKSIQYFKKGIRMLNGSDKGFEARINSNIAAVYAEYLDKPDSALYYLNKDVNYLKENKKTHDLCLNYVNQAAAYYYLEDYPKAIEYLKMADKLPLSEYEGKTRQYIYEFLYKNYQELGDYDNAFKYMELNKKFADSINATEQNIAINEIQTKYQTKEKELENTKLKNNIETNRILLYTSIGALLAVAAIALLLVKNARRKEKISKQEKLIEQQKLEKALKDYEINSIDMMLEGQEKERQRIANDLHDNLGSMLATLKLNFENLKLRKSELRDEETKLYERTDELIEEAYQKVRRLAHAKNAGVLATEGLIPAIKKLAEKISIPGKLQMQVVPFGFNNRLDNTIEIMIFRAVQELGTNIIKHSQATEATIHLTHHDDIINIIIEDNGIGFKSSELQMNDGMGLQAIRKKIEQLGGTFTIDSMPGKGTTILIDIPV